MRKRHELSMNVNHKRAPDSYVKSLERKTEKAAESHKVYVCACVLFRGNIWSAFGRIADIDQKGNRRVRELRSIRHVHNAELDKDAIVSVIQCACTDVETHLIHKRYCKRKKEEIIMVSPLTGIYV